MRITLKAYDHELVDSSAKKIIETVKKNGSQVSGPVPLPTKNAVIAKLENLGHTVYDCTCDENTSQNGCLATIVGKCNSHNVDIIYSSYIK